jgi:glycosyltransferase involved in cell wall biosynthesis
MNIAYFSHYFVPEIGAPSARIYDLSREWIAGGDRVEVVTCFPNHPSGILYPGYAKGRYLFETVDEIEVHRVWSYITPNKGFLKKSIGHVSFYPSALLGSRRLRRNPDVLVGTSPTFFAAMAAEREARRRKRPFIMEVRDLWPAIFVELGVLKNRLMIRALEKLELSLYRRSARIVTVTEAFRQDLIRRGVPEAKVATVRNGADVEFWRETDEGEALRSRYGIGEELVVLYIGAHGISQALKSVLEAATRLRDRGVRFVFVGEGAEKEHLVRFAAEEKLQNVTFVNPVGKEEVRAFYSMADVCVVPLRSIPLFTTFIPSKMFEIFSVGRPIIGSVAGEAAEILESSGGAVVVPPEDDAALAGAIEELQSDPERRAGMGRRGRDFVVNHYSRRALAARYREIMDEAVDDPMRDG